MTFIAKKQIEIGSKVRLLEDIEVLAGTFTKGHEFEVYGYDNMRGFDLIDKDGNKLCETRFVHHLLELIE